MKLRHKYLICIINSQHKIPMEKEIKKLEQHLKLVGSPIFQYLGEGLSQKQLEEFIRATYGEDVFVSDELIELYSWHNGIDESSIDPERIKEGYFAYELFLNSTREVTEVIDGYEFYNFKSQNLFPAISSLNGEFVAVHLQQGGKLYYCATFDPDLEPITSMFDSIESMLSTVNRLYDIHFFKLDEDGIIESDIEKYEDYLRIGRELNPNSDFWKIKLEYL
jgi:hypothetical protein